MEGVVSAFTDKVKSLLFLSLYTQFDKNEDVCDVRQTDIKYHKK